jgi:hypothetical protein
MPDIGSTLREARMRARIDISEIEAETKIRAKYLRALENEEWDLLPGPTYVKTFLRTYAEVLGLDAKLLVEEYKLRHERLNENELRPIRPPSQSTRRRAPAGPVIPRWAPLALVVALIVAALYALGSATGGDDDEPGAANTIVPPSTRTTKTSATPGAATPARRRKAVSKVARLTIVPTGPVFVCLRASGNRTLVDGASLDVGQNRGPFRATSFTLTLGNANVRLRLNGKTLKVSPSSEPIGLRITRKGRTPLSAAARPDCA